MDLNKASLVNFPENLILEIFSYLSRKKLCQIARVCKQWHRITRDKSLWRHVDITPDALNDKNRKIMWKFLRSLSEVLLTLKLRSGDSSADEGDNSGETNATLQNLQGWFPNLRTLGLYNCDLEPVNAALLPSSLHTLDLYRSAVPLGWFKPIEAGRLKNLKVLKVSRCYRISTIDLEHISKVATLEILDLSECYRVTDDALRVVGTRCTDRALHHISRNLKNLKVLDVSETGLSDATVGSVISSLKNLKVLKLFGCSRITMNNLEHINEVADLEVLDLGDCYRVTDKALKVVAEKLTCLAELHINGTSFTYRALHHISMNLKNLKLLDMSGNWTLSDTAVGSVTSGLKNLVHLDMSGCIRLTDAAVNSIANNLKQLEVFHFYNTNTTCEPVRSFSKKMPKLRDIAMGNIDDEGLESLVPLELVSLGVGVANVSEEGLSQFHKFKNLKKLTLNNCQSERAIQILKGQLPGCVVLTTV